MYRIIILIIIILVQSATSQIFIEKVTDGWGDGVIKSAPIVTDLDQDNLYDILMGRWDGSLNHYEQVENSSFEFHLKTKDFCNIKLFRDSQPAITDFERDDILDLIVCQSSENKIYHYKQVHIGSENFALVSDNFNNIASNGGAPFFIDINDDNLLDFFIGKYSGQIAHYQQDLNNPHLFVQISSQFNNISVGTNAVPIFRDINNDNKIDLLVGAKSGIIRHYSQDSLSSLSFHIENYWFNNIDIGWKSSPYLVDINNDGLLELLIGEADGVINLFSQVYPDSFYFTHVTDNLLNVYDTGSYSSLSVADFDDNGLNEMLVSGILPYDNTGKFFLFEQQISNQSKYQIINYNYLDSLAGRERFPFFCNIDGDQYLDLLIGFGGPSGPTGKIYYCEQDSVDNFKFNLIDENFNSIDYSRDAYPSIVDLDKDGLLDLIVGFGDGTIHHYVQQSINSLTFNLITQNFNNIDIASHAAPTFADIDEDGLFDLIIGDSYGYIHHYKQDSQDLLSFYHITSFYNSINIRNEPAFPRFFDLDNDGIDELLIGSGNGGIHYFYKSNSSNITVFENAFNSFHLYNSYPNPFNSSVNIEFSLPIKSDVKISIFNSLGEKIKTIVNKNFNVGKNKINFYTNDMASGTYFLQIITPNNIMTQKLILIK